LEDAQEALGIGPHDYVFVTYVSEMVWYQELLRYAPILLILGSLIYFGRRMQSGFGVSGPRGKGGHRLINIRKICENIIRSAHSMKKSYGAHLNQSQVMAKHILFWRLFKFYKKVIF